MSARKIYSTAKSVLMVELIDADGNANSNTVRFIQGDEDGLANRPPVHPGHTATRLIYATIALERICR
jgi:hypothetical protein